MEPTPYLTFNSVFKKLFCGQRYCQPISLSIVGREEPGLLQSGSVECFAFWFTVCPDYLLYIHSDVAVWQGKLN